MRPRPICRGLIKAPTSLHENRFHSPPVSNSHSCPQQLTLPCPNREVLMNACSRQLLDSAANPMEPWVTLTFASVLMYLLNLLNASMLNFISSPRRSK